MALDLFAIPAILLKCEYIFSKVSYTIVVQKSNLSFDIVEKREYFYIWISSKIVELTILV